MRKEFELQPHAAPVVLYVMISCAGKMIVIQLNPQFLYQFNYLFTALWNRRNKSQTEDNQKICCAGVRKKSDRMG